MNSSQFTWFEWVFPWIIVLNGDTMNYTIWIVMRAFRAHAQNSQPTDTNECMWERERARLGLTEKWKRKKKWKKAFYTPVNYLKKSHELVIYMCVFVTLCIASHSVCLSMGNIIEKKKQNIDVNSFKLWNEIFPSHKTIELDMCNM